MKMSSVKRPRLELKDFLELLLMWHKAGDVPRDRTEMQEFIEADEFVEYLQAVQFWCNEFGLHHPTRSDVVRTLTTFY